MSRSLRSTVAVVFLPLVVAGCSLVAQPDTAGWDRSARQAVTDATSEVATARLAVETAQEEQAWSTYTLVVVAEAEEAMGTVQDDVSRLQVPSGRGKDADDLEALLDEAAAAVQEARQHAAEGRYDDPELLEHLDRVKELLSRAEERW